MDLEKSRRVTVLETSRRHFGWGCSKFEPWFLDTPEHFLVLDSDIVFLGPVLDRFTDINTDIVVSSYEGIHPDLSRYYFDVKKMAVFDPLYQFPGYTFNSGHIVGRGGLFNESDLHPFVDYSKAIPRLRSPELFRAGDQGLFNYLFWKLSTERGISVKRSNYYIWAGSPGLDEISLQSVEDCRLTTMVHWAGRKGTESEMKSKSHLLRHFETLSEPQAIERHLPRPPIQLK